MRRPRTTRVNAAEQNGENFRLNCSTVASLKQKFDGSSSNSLSAEVLKLTLLRVAVELRKPSFSSSSKSPLSHGRSRVSSLRWIEPLKNIVVFYICFLKVLGLKKMLKANRECVLLELEENPRKILKMASKIKLTVRNAPYQFCRLPSKIISLLREIVSRWGCNLKIDALTF